MKALIVGGKGQLGTALARTAPEGVRYRSLDLPELDVTRLNDLVAAVEEARPDVVVNASAYTAVDRAEADVAAAYAVNAAGAHNLAMAAKQAGCRLIHVSTDYVFDGTACTPYPPQAPCTPLGVYGQSKRDGEIQVLTVLDSSLIVRTSWLYSSTGSNFVLTMLRLMNERPEIRVVADQIGAPTWADSLAGAIWSTARKTHLHGIYHWSDAGVASWYDFAVAIQEEGLERGLLNRRVPIHPITTAEFPTPTRRPAYSVLDCTASRRDFEIEPMHWRAALRKMLDAVGREQ